MNKNLFISFLLYYIILDFCFALLVYVKNPVIFYDILYLLNFYEYLILFLFSFIVSLLVYFNLE